MKKITRTVALHFTAVAIVATSLTSTPVWAEDAPSLNVTCLCYEEAKKTYKAFMLIDDQTRPEYEALIVAGKITLRKQVNLVPGSCTAEEAKKLSLAAFKCTPDMYVSEPITVQIKSTSSIPLTEDASGKDVLRMDKWAKIPSFGLYGKLPE